MSTPDPARMPYVFISYASADRERVLHVVEALRAAGLQVWIDQEAIPGGTVYAPEIVGGIERCHALVLMCSAASLASPNVRQEIALAWKYRRPYLPLLLEPVAIPREVEYWLEGSQWVEVLDQPEAVWLPRVLTALGRFGVAVGDDAGGHLPPTAALTPPTTNRLPTPLTTLVGRQADVARLTSMLRANRLVTLIGPGGTGKTRLAIEVAHVLSGAFAGGAAFVPLAAVRDPALVVPSIAAALDVRDAGDEPLLATLARSIGARQLLLVLDNCEQIVDAAPAIADLLGHAPGLHVVATSRVPLRISGEWEHAVQPLPLPDAGPTDLDTLRANDAVRLFVERAAAVRSGFALTTENAGAVATICRVLAGLPLAIELAAARCKLLTPQAVLARLEQPLNVLTGGARDLPERQQTMRGAVQWSYDLLAPDEQRLFRQLAVFAGGWTLEATEPVVEAGTLDLFDGLTSLIEKSLVTQTEQPDDEPRFGMLGPIQAFGLEQLHARGELDAARQRLALFVADLATRAEGAWFTADEHLWSARLDAERDNLRAALAWCIEAPTPQPENARMGMRIAVGCWAYWDTLGYGREALDWHERLLESDTTPSVERARLLSHACRVLCEPARR
jgi:predicted ATPase